MLLGIRCQSYVIGCKMDLVSLRRGAKIQSFGQNMPLLCV